MKNLYIFLSLAFSTLLILNANAQNELNEVVVSGTLKPVKRLESPVPVEVYTYFYAKTGL